MNIAVCDDDENELKALHEMIDRWADEKGRIVMVHEFSRGEVLCNTILDGKMYDLFILDVLMPEMDGISLAKKLRASNCVADGTPIIFLTSSKDYAVESYDVRAFYYLIKPVGHEKFDGVLTDAVQRIEEKKDDVIFVRTRDGVYSTSLDEIYYMTLADRAIKYICVGRELISRTIAQSFRNATAQLDDDKRFFRCGASTIVNVARIKLIDRNHVVFDAGPEITVPRNTAKPLYQAWLDYWLD